MDEFNNCNDKDKNNIKELLSEIKNICEKLDEEKYMIYKKKFIRKNNKTKKRNNQTKNELHRKIHKTIKTMPNVIDNFNNIKDFI
jgi:transcriptional regulator with AAA-type ATPase domain